MVKTIVHHIGLGDQIMLNDISLQLGSVINTYIKDVDVL